MKRSALLFVTNVVLAMPCVASADERSVLTDKVVATGALPCMSMAFKLFNHQIRARAPDNVMLSLGAHLKYGAGWKAGNPVYDAVRTEIDQALADDERKNGPLFAVTVKTMLQHTAALWSMDDLRYLAAFFSTAEGKLFWNRLFEGGHCAELLNESIVPPFPKLPSPLKEMRNQTIVLIPAARDRWNAEYSRLNLFQKASYTDARAKVGKSVETAILKLYSYNYPPVLPRLDKSVQPASMRLAKTYKSGPVALK